MSLAAPLRTWIAIIATSILGACVMAGPAQAFGIEHFDGIVTNRDGTGATQAGSHPWAASITIGFPTTTDSAGHLTPAGNVKDIEIDLPAGFIGDPSATPKCTSEQLDTFNFATFSPNCPPESQVGVVSVPQATGGPTASTFVLPLYNLVAPKGVPAEFGFNVITFPVRARASVRSGGDYGVTVKVRDVPQPTNIVGTTMTLWGVPADPRHDPDRGNFCIDLGGGLTCLGGGRPSTAVPKPFLTNPTDCSAGPLTTRVRVDSWQDPGNFKTASFASHLPDGTPAGVDGCDKLPFDPSITVQPDVTVADSPGGLAVDVRIPQNDNPTGLAQGLLRKAVVTLPLGMTVSPASADGLGACSPQQIGLDNANEPSCPDVSKIGTVEVDTPLLPDPLKGAVYLAQQNNNPFESLLAIYVTAEADGVLVKLAGHVVPDPVTGQLTTTFDNNPQLPFTDFKLHFFGGSRAPLATPESCGTFTTTSSLTPWSGTAAVTPSDSFTTNSGCVSGFSPSFRAGTTNPQAGAHSPFVLSFSRSDTDQELFGLSATLPPGLLAKVAGVTLCSQAAAGAGACPDASQVGSVNVGSGPGSNPFFLPGKAYLTGPYKGAPYGLAVVVPAIAGPFNLGTVVVRQALFIDPTDAHVTVKSDPFPTILDGIPLRMRRVDVNMDRPGFMVNPTSCDPMQVTGLLSSVSGLSAPVSSRFQVGGCSDLGFSPKLAIAVRGGQMRPGQHPGISATLTQPAGEANIRSVRVALPLSLALDPANSQVVCSVAAAAALDCPANTIVGIATAVTPLLPHPLSGNVYLVQGIRTNSKGQQIRTLPTLLLPLHGPDGVALNLRAQSSVSNDQLVTTFGAVPDAPVSSFKLHINGGAKGILVVTGSKTLCHAKQVASVVETAQSGKQQTPDVQITAPCHQSLKKAKRSSKHRA